MTQCRPLIGHLVLQQPGLGEVQRVVQQLRAVDHVYRRVVPRQLGRDQSPVTLVVIHSVKYLQVFISIIHLKVLVS